MFMLEVTNSLLATFIATELQRSRARFRHRALGVACITAVLLNVLSPQKISWGKSLGAAYNVSSPAREIPLVAVNEALASHKGLIVTNLYLAACFVDCRRAVEGCTIHAFSKHLPRAFFRSVIAFPIIAIMFSAVLFVVARINGILGLSDEWLNDPIYYGVFYGPFISFYFYIKSSVLFELGRQPLLPA